MYQFGQGFIKFWSGTIATFTPPQPLTSLTGALGRGPRFSVVILVVPGFLEHLYFDFGRSILGNEQRTRGFEYLA